MKHRSNVCLDALRASRQTLDLRLIAFASDSSSSCGFFSFALDARFLVVCSTASFSENAVLLNFTVEALECSLKRFVIADFDF